MPAISPLDWDQPKPDNAAPPGCRRQRPHLPLLRRLVVDPLPRLRLSSGRREGASVIDGSEAQRR